MHIIQFLKMISLLFILSLKKANVTPHGKANNVSYQKRSFVKNKNTQKQAVKTQIVITVDFILFVLLSIPNIIAT